MFSSTSRGPFEEAARRENFSHVATLSGMEMSIRPNFLDGQVLGNTCGRAGDEGHFAGAEHEEWMGNSGALSAFQYKTSAVLIVPPSRVLQLTMSHASKIDDALGMFPVLRQNAKGDEKATTKLQGLCQLVLRASEPQKCNEVPPTAETLQRIHCLDQVVLASIKNGWLHLAERSFLEKEPRLEHLQLYSRYVATQEITSRKDGL